MDRNIVSLYLQGSGIRSGLPSWLAKMYLYLFGAPLLGKKFRARIMYKILADLEVKGKKVLDAGCGIGDISLELARRGAKVTAIDRDKRKIANAKKLAASLYSYCKFIESDLLTATNDPIEEYNIVICLAVLDYLEEDERLLANFARILKRGGELILGFPIINRKIDYDFQREEQAVSVRSGYDLNTLAKKLESLGFIQLRKFTLLPGNIYYYYSRAVRMLKKLGFTQQMGMVLLCPGFYLAGRVIEFIFPGKDTEMILVLERE